MHRGGRIAAIFVILFLAAGFGLGGYALGHRQGWSEAFGFLEVEVEGGTMQRADALCRLKLGDQEGAVQLLEGALDQSVVTIPQGRPFAALPPRAQQALIAAKVYRTAVPLNDQDRGVSGVTGAELNAVLDQVRVPQKLEFCEGNGIDRLHRQMAGTPDEDGAP